LTIYDADHHPDPESLLVATAYMRKHKCDCVQGSTYLRITNSPMAYFINAEFFVTHFVYFPALQFLTTMGVFGGSNAVWKVATLRAYEFRSDVQTEDVELSTRVLLGR
jgi:cellulose synthase/poly-beta-1,6-N-acetylglucosamine synthase-like glycosyltransferase